ncbi:hypothetical protein [Chromobacterium violaceum]|uniref:hypothetical protein n=1 Tax=Chromobacterium violaceum TaxID=536 RepID=UPI001B33C424|nr:hypothetical protein [Chromobacterium violaceum]MBP4047323.1 hypothetical protein [Chromobacterium violaceum]
MQRIAQHALDFAVQLVALQVEDVALAEQQAMHVAAAVIEHVYAMAVWPYGGDAVAQLVMLVRLEMDSSNSFRLRIDFILFFLVDD